MIPSENYLSENSDPQRFLILWKLWWYLKTKFPSVSKVTSSRISHLILWQCCHVVHFPLKSFFMYIHPKNPATALMYIRDILTATRTFSWYMWISWENSDDILRQSDGIFPSSPVNHMVDWYSWQTPAKISFHTEKTQIKVPATQNILNTHITPKMDLATCTIFFRWFPAFMVDVGKMGFPDISG